MRAAGSPRDGCAFKFAGEEQAGFDFVESSLKWAQAHERRSDEVRRI
jgi:hypothetical protein